MKIKACETMRFLSGGSKQKNDRYRRQISPLKRKPVNVLNNLQFESAYKIATTMYDDCVLNVALLYCVVGIQTAYKIM